MQTIELQPNQSAEKIAELTGGTIIMVNGSTLMMVGADLSKLEVA